tara:strand:- start:87 stop:440 length:354 start_codon:yes stop_codon:yes gene_type:complete
MCGGGPSGPSEEDKKEADERHQENLALQREQMAEQKRQFELSRQDNQARYREQKAASKAAPPPAPEKTAGVAAPAIESLKINKGGRRKYINPPKASTSEGAKAPRKTFNSKNLYIGN